MNFNTREATTDDGEELLELWFEFTDHLSTFDDRYRAKEDAAEEWLSYFEHQLVDSKYSTVLLAENDAGVAVGVLEARVVGEHPIFQLERHGQIHGMYVREGMRESGVGRQLLNGATDWLQDRPRSVSFYRIDVGSGDDAAAKALEEMGNSPVKQTFESTVQS